MATDDLATDDLATDDLATDDLMTDDQTADPAPRGAFVEVLGARVHYVERGPRDAVGPRPDGGGPDTPTAVLVHGLGVDHRLVLEAYDQLLAERGWRRLYVDLPGMGASEAPAWVAGSDDVLRVLRGCVEKLAPSGAVVLVGQSYGGYLVRGLAAALAARVVGLSLVVPVVGPVDRDLPDRQVLVRDPALVDQVGLEALEDADSLLVVQTPDTWARSSARFVGGDDDALARIRAGYQGTFVVEPAPLDAPALILAGRQDHVTGYRDAWRIVEAYPRASFVVLDLAGHDLPFEQTTLFEAHVREWLDRVETAAARHGGVPEVPSG